jgi:hypothetical protein
MSISNSHDPLEPGELNVRSRQKARGEGFTFTYRPDSHLASTAGRPGRTALYTDAAQLVADQPDFHIDLGDTIAIDPLDPYGTGLPYCLSGSDARFRHIGSNFLLESIQRLYASLPMHRQPRDEEGWNWDDTYAHGNKSQQSLLISPQEVRPQSHIRRRFL